MRTIGREPPFALLVQDPQMLGKVLTGNVPFLTYVVATRVFSV